MAHLKDICDFDDCEELVDATRVFPHMETHGAYFPHQWRLKRWPDGTAVVVDTDDGVPDG